MLTTVKELAVKNGLKGKTRDTCLPIVLPDIVKWILKEYGWNKERCFRVFVKEAKRKELNRFIATYQTCVKYGLKPEATRALLDTVCCCGTNWNQVEQAWLKGEEW